MIGKWSLNDSKTILKLFEPRDSADRRAVAISEFKREAAEPEQVGSALPQIAKILYIDDILILE